MAGLMTAGQAAAPPSAEDEGISLNFQDVEVARRPCRPSPTSPASTWWSATPVVGRITRRLDEVPWRQALDLILQAEGLGQRQVGGVVLIAPVARNRRRRAAAFGDERKMETLPRCIRSTFTSAMPGGRPWALFPRVWR